DILADEVRETERIVRERGVRGLGVYCDVSTEAAVAGLIERVVSEFGRLDVLVNTVAWIDPPGLVVDMQLEVWENTLKYDLTTHFLCCKHALRGMIERNYGRIVNVSSEAGNRSLQARVGTCPSTPGRGLARDSKSATIGPSSDGSQREPLSTSGPTAAVSITASCPPRT